MKFFHRFPKSDLMIKIPNCFDKQTSWRYVHKHHHRSTVKSHRACPSNLHHIIHSLSNRTTFAAQIHALRNGLFATATIFGILLALLASNRFNVEPVRPKCSSGLGTHAFRTLYNTWQFQPTNPQWNGCSEGV